MTTPPIPPTIEAITPEWLAAALRRTGPIAGARVESIGRGAGVLCQLARVTLDGEDEAGRPGTLVAKLATQEPQTREMVRLFRFYEREVAFYRDLAAALPLATPRCYHAEYDAASGDFVLLLEDMGAARIGDQLAGCSAGDGQLVIDELARLHAGWWNHPRLDAMPWLPPINHEVNKMGLGLYPAAWPIFLERFGGRLPEAARALGERLGAHVVEQLDQIGGRPHTVCHGDVRLDNLFFGAGAGHAPLTFIDWQIAGRAVGTFDVAYFLSQSLAPDVRRGCEERLLRRYHAALVAGGVRDYDFERCLLDYRRSVLFCFVYPVMAGGLGDLSNERGFALAAAMTQRSAAAMLDWNTAELLPA